MKTSLAALGFCLFALCVADVLQLDLEAEDRDSTETNDLRTQAQISPGNLVEIEASIGDVENAGSSHVRITHVYTNTGAYNTSTGVFTAPVSGRYHFSFSADDKSPQPVTLRLLENGEQRDSVLSHRAGSSSETGTDGVTLRLGSGEQVAMRLRIRIKIRIRIRISIHK